MVKTTFTMILGFTTGVPGLPPAGFNPTPTIAFRHRRDLKYDKASDKFLVVANTCCNKIILPVDHRQRRGIKFMNDLELAFCGASGFAPETIIHDMDDDIVVVE